MNKDISAAMLGDHEAAKRLTDFQTLMEMKRKPTLSLHWKTNGRDNLLSQFPTRKKQNVFLWAFEEIKTAAQNNLGKKYAAGCDGYYRDKIELAEAALKALYAYKEDEIEKH